jgi:hypothetical protein
MVRATSKSAMEVLCAAMSTAPSSAARKERTWSCHCCSAAVARFGPHWDAKEVQLRRRPRRATARAQREEEEGWRWAGLAVELERGAGRRRLVVATHAEEKGAGRLVVVA